MRLATFVSVLLLLAPLSVPADTVTYAYDDLGRLLRVQYAGGKTITYSYDKAGNLLRRLVTGPAQPGPAPAATAAGVVNAASFLGGSVAAGEIVTVFGTGIGPGTLVGLRLTRAGLVDNFLADTQVTFDGAPSPLVYVSERQTSAIVPYAVAGKSSTEMIVEYQGRRSAGSLFRWPPPPRYSRSTPPAKAAVPFSTRTPR